MPGLLAVILADVDGVVMGNSCILDGRHFEANLQSAFIQSLDQVNCLAARGIYSSVAESRTGCEGSQNSVRSRQQLYHAIYY